MLLPASVVTSRADPTIGTSEHRVLPSSNLTAESSRRSENQHIPHTMTNFGAPSHYGFARTPESLPGLPVGMPHSNAREHHQLGHAHIQDWRYAAQAHQYGAAQHTWHGYMPYERPVHVPQGQHVAYGRYQPGSVNADQSAFEFGSRDQHPQYQQPAPGAASDAFSRYTQHQMQPKAQSLGAALPPGSKVMYAPPGHEHLVQHVGASHATSHPAAPSGHPTPAPSLQSQNTAAHSSLSSYGPSISHSGPVSGFHDMGRTAQHAAAPPVASATPRAPHSVSSLGRDPATASGLTHLAQRSVGYQMATYGTQAVPEDGHFRSKSPLSLTKREKAAAERDTLPVQFRGSRVLSFQPTENRWLTVYTEYKTRRQVRLYGSSAVSACLRRDYERIRSGIKPRINGRGKCTWLTLVNKEMFAAFCSWRRSSAAESRSPSPGSGGHDGLVWTGPSPDELDAAALRMGTPLSMHNWKEVCAHARQLSLAAASSHGHQV